MSGLSISDTGYWLGGAQIVEIRRLDVGVPLGTRFDAARIQGDVAATSVEGDFLFRDDMDLVFRAGDLQALPRSTRPIDPRQYHPLAICPCLAGF